MTKYALLVPALIVFILNIFGCGGGGGGGSSKHLQATTVQGIAAAGSPIAGTVYLLDSSTPAKEVSAKTTVAGEFSIDTKGLKAPFLLKAVDSSNNNLFSYANAPGDVNINPLSTLAVAVASGATDSNSLTTLYKACLRGDASAMTRMQGISDVISTASSNITKSLQKLLEAYCPNDSGLTADFLYGPYLVNHQGLDDMFDKVSIMITNDANGTAVITRNDNNTTVFKTLLSDLLDSDQSDKLDIGNIPAPAKYDIPGNTALTLKVRGDLPQGALIKKAVFSIKLPLGVTVVTPASGPSVSVYTIAVPLGQAAGSNIYPAPMLSDANNILQISISSLAGFRTGDFLKVRYIDSLPDYMKKRIPSDFSISGVQFYSDIYNSQELQNLTIVPDSITFP